MAVKASVEDIDYIFSLYWDYPFVSDSLSTTTTYCVWWSWKSQPQSVKALGKKQNKKSHLAQKPFHTECYSFINNFVILMTTFKYT